MAYALAHEGMIQKETTQQKDSKWYLESEEVTHYMVKRPKRDANAERLNDFFFRYKSTKTGAHLPIMTKTSFDATNYENWWTLSQHIDLKIDAAIQNILRSKFALEEYLQKGKKHIHLYLDGHGKFKFTRTEAAENANLEISIRFHPTMQHMLGLTAYPTIDYGWVDLKLGITAPYIWDLKKSPISSMWIFCDIVSPTYVKNLSVPILRLSPIDRISRQISYESAANLQYKLLCTNNVQQIKIWISENYTGEPIHSKSHVYVNLHFMKTS